MLGGGAWVDDAVHTATARAETPCVVLAIRVSDVRVDGRLRELSKRLSEQLGALWKQELLRTQLPLFRDLPATAHEQLASLMTPRHVAPGTVLIREAEWPSCLYVLALGEIECFRQGVPGVQGVLQLSVIDERAEVTYFGEVSLLLDMPRTCAAAPSLPQPWHAMRRPASRCGRGG